MQIETRTQFNLPGHNKSYKKVTAVAEPKLKICHNILEQNLGQTDTTRYRVAMQLKIHSRHVWTREEIK
jgi:hypothetical protein